MQKTMKITIVLFCIALLFYPSVNAKPDYARHSPMQQEWPEFELTRNITVIVDNTEITILGYNWSYLAEGRPQLENDSMFYKGVRNYTEIVTYYAANNEILILAGMNGTSLFELYFNLESRTGPVEELTILSDNNLTTNAVDIISETLNVLRETKHILVDNAIQIFLWSGSFGRPTIYNSVTKYYNNESFTKLHWEVFFRTNVTTSGGVYIHSPQKYNTDAFMYFSTEGELLGFDQVILPIDDSTSGLVIGIVIFGSLSMILVFAVIIYKKRN